MRIRPAVIPLLTLALALPPCAAWAEGIPRDIQAFLDKREGCDHLRGEDIERARIHKACAGTDKELAQLKRKYANNSTILQLLNQFEPEVEAVNEAANESATAPAQKSRAG